MADQARVVEDTDDPGDHGGAEARVFLAFAVLLVVILLLTALDPNHHGNW